MQQFHCFPKCVSEAFQKQFASTTNVGCACKKETFWEVIFPYPVATMFPCLRGSLYARHSQSTPIGWKATKLALIGYCAQPKAQCTISDTFICLSQPQF